MCACAAYVCTHTTQLSVIHAAILMFQLVFEGVRGNGYAGDIALDDLTFSTSCPKPGKKPIFVPTSFL